MSEVTLFVRKASGLVRSWSMFDAFVYATFSINLITLGLFIFSFAYWFEGNLITAIVVGGALTIFEVIVYASLISAMPRAGGDYVWQSRILGRGIGFILSVTGWWFILWLWVPLYAQMLAYQVFTPLLAILGARDLAIAASSSNGFLVAALVLCVLVSIYIAAGMKLYARVQKICFWGGVIGLALVFLLLLFGNNQIFQNNLNSIVPQMFGTDPSTDLYAATLTAGEAAGAKPDSLRSVSLIASFALIPLIVFFNLWPNWGATLYGEVRGASDYKRNFWGMATAVIVTGLLGVIFLLLIAKTLGWGFYQAANGAFWGPVYDSTLQPAPMPFWPYPALFAAFMVNSRVVQFLVIALMSLWWFGWSGTVFLSSTRVIFAAAFDRMLPEWASYVEPRTRTPIVALLLMVVPSLIISILYAFNIFNFTTLVLDATLVIAVTFLGTAVAAILLPWRAKEAFEGSPIAKFLVPTWLSWLGLLVFVAGGLYLIVTSFRYAGSVFSTQFASGSDVLTLAMVIVVSLLTLINAVLILWLLYSVGRRILAETKMPLVTFSGLVFFVFLDWLLVEWLWDPQLAYGIGWSNVSSMLFMLINYAVAAVIYFGFSAYRKRQGIDVSKVYKAIPVE